MTASTWPDPARPGVPLNPEVDGWHWLKRISNGWEMPAKWDNDWNGNDDFWWNLPGCSDPEKVAKDFFYLGPCLTPEEVQNLRDDLASSERERAHQHSRADRNSSEYAREQAKREALQKRVARLEGALRMAAECIDADDTISARGFLSDALIKKHKPKWVCPNNTPGCVKNCGNYGCGN